MKRPNDEGPIRDSEMALFGAIQTILEIVMTADIAKPSVIANMLSHQRDGYRKKMMPNAVAITQLLIDFVNDPQREAHRTTLRTILREPPAGSA